ncbi:MAG: hypothetical protein R3C56_09890 [Pirellulaceae bacterium]
MGAAKCTDPRSANHASHLADTRALPGLPSVCRQSLVQALTLTPSVDTSATAPVAFPRRSADLLLVEDSLISQTVLKDMLQSLGHTSSDCSGRGRLTPADQVVRLGADEYSDARHGWARNYASHSPAHEQGSSRRQCIYALTAHATSRDRQQCEAASMDGFLVKPISRDRLSEAIDLVLGNYSDGTSDRPASLTANRPLNCSLRRR